MQNFSKVLSVALVVFAFIPALAQAQNAGDFAGGVAIGTAYANTITAPTNGLAVQGNIGVGTATPQSEVQVYNGELQVGSSGTGCTNTNAGAMRYDGSSLSYCNGSNWQPISNSSNYSYGGYVNKFRNGTLDIWQRGTSSLTASTSGAYTADGWIVKQTGSAHTCAQATGTNGTLYALKCMGGTGNTDTQIYQRIESNMAAPLAGNTVTVQWQYQQNTGASVTPEVSTCYASTQDNFATCTGDLSTTSLSACASGSWCTESYTFTISSSASNGYQVMLDCNTALTSAQSCQITAADIRMTPGISTGINSYPPPPELRPIGAEMPLNYRYYFAMSGLKWYGNIVDTNDTARHLSFAWPVVMRATPTISQTWSAGTTNTPDSLTAYGAAISTFIGNTISFPYLISLTASSEL